MATNGHQQEIVLENWSMEISERSFREAKEATKFLSTCSRYSSTPVLPDHAFSSMTSK
jgi:hypothetical protein